jgi:hypothetical protein
LAKDFIKRAEENERLNPTDGFGRRPASPGEREAVDVQREAAGQRVDGDDATIYRTPDEPAEDAIRAMDEIVEKWRAGKRAGRQGW